MRLFTRTNPAGAQALYDGTGNIGSDMVLRKISNSSIFTFPTGTGHPPSFISPEAGQLEVIWNICLKAVEKAKQTLGIYAADGSVDSAAVASKFKNFLPALALHEKRMLRAAGTYIGAPVGDISISYAMDAEPIDVVWMDAANKVATAEWLSPEARTLIIQDMTRSKIEDMGVSMINFESIVNGVAVKDAATLAGETAAAVSAASGNTSGGNTGNNESSTPA